MTFIPKRNWTAPVILERHCGINRNLLSLRISSHILLISPVLTWQSRYSESSTGITITKPLSTGALSPYGCTIKQLRHDTKLHPASSRGRTPRYSDLTITTVLMIKRVFRLTLRTVLGFIDPFFAQMGLLYAARITPVSAKISVLKRPPGARSPIWWSIPVGWRSPLKVNGK